MDPLHLMLCPSGLCNVAQTFGENATTEYSTDGLRGHPGWDIHCGYGSTIEAPFDMYVYSVIGADSPLLGPEGYTQIGGIVETPLETFEWIIGHCDPLCKIGPVTKGAVLATEANHGPVWDAPIQTIPVLSSRRMNILMRRSASSLGHFRGAEEVRRRPFRTQRRLCSKVIRPTEAS